MSDGSEWDGFIAIRKRQNKDTTILAAARHNKRAIQAECSALHIDPSRSHRNFALRGKATAEEVDALAKRLMAEAGVAKPRKDAVIFIEIVFSLSPEDPLDPRAYFEACTKWVESEFECPLLASDVHLDEPANPHCHVLLLPLVNGRLNGSQLVGGKSQFRARIDRFFAHVRPLGIRRPPARLTGASKAAAAHAVLNAIRATDDPAIHSAAWPAIRRAIEEDPRPYMPPFGVESPSRQLPSFEHYRLSKGKGPRWEPDFVPPFDANDSTPLLGEAAPPDTLPLSCVGEAPEHTLSPDASIATSAPDTLDQQQPRHAD